MVSHHSHFIREDWLIPRWACSSLTLHNSFTWHSKEEAQIVNCYIVGVMIAHRQWPLIRSFRTYFLWHRVYPTFLLVFRKIRILVDSWPYLDTFLQKAMPLMHLFSTKQLAKEKRLATWHVGVFYCLSSIHFPDSKPSSNQRKERLPSGNWPSDPNTIFLPLCFIIKSRRDLVYSPWNFHDKLSNLQSFGWLHYSCSQGFVGLIPCNFKVL